MVPDQRLTKDSSRKKYEAVAAFWRKGTLVPAGAELMLSDTEAKYIRHILKDVKPVEPVVEIVPEAAPEVIAFPAELADEVIFEDRRSKRRKG